MKISFTVVRSTPAFFASCVCARFWSSRTIAVKRSGVRRFAWLAAIMVVLGAITGPDGQDGTVVPASYAWDPTRPLSSVRVGYFKSAFEAKSSTQEKDNHTNHH